MWWWWLQLLQLLHARHSHTAAWGIWQLTIAALVVNNTYVLCNILALIGNVLVTFAPFICMKTPKTIWKMNVFEDSFNKLFENEVII